MLLSPPTESDSYGQLCDQLFHTEPDDWWTDEPEESLKERFRSLSQDEQAIPSSFCRESATARGYDEQGRGIVTMTRPQPVPHIAEAGAQPVSTPTGGRKRRRKGSWHRRLGWASLRPCSA